MHNRRGTKTLIARELSAAQPKFPKGEDDFYDVSFRVKSDALYSLLKLLRHCERCGSIGHSFQIVIDPDNSEYRKTVGFDGDGSDRIEDIQVGGKPLPKDFDK